MTVKRSAATPQEGRDAFYMVPGTDRVAAVGPGSAGYHGGQWQVFLVESNVAQYPSTSVAAILTAETAGDIGLTGAADLDFLCPIQP
jgi:hypothetical protein